MKKYLGLIIVILLSFWAVRPIFHQFMFPIHDNTQVVRVYEMAKALTDGQFPVRWVADLGYGYGYPIFNFYSPLPYYFGAVLVILGFNVLTATKLMFIAGILLAGVFMYLLAKEFWGEFGGIISALFFMYAPYHAVQVYVRGAVGEFWAFAFLPLVFYGLCKSMRERKFKWIIIGGLGFTAVILSHNITAMILALLLVITLCFTFLLKKRNLTYYLLLITFLGLSLSAFFWLPAIFEAKYTNVDSLIRGTDNFRLHFVCLKQLWDSPWGFGGSIAGCEDGLSFKIGKLHILMVIISLITAILWRRREKFKSKIILFSIFYFLFSIFMTLGVSKSLWEAIPALSFVQYPWRFLGFVIFFASFLSGTVFNYIKNRYFVVVACCLLLVVLLFYNAKYFQPQKYLNLSAADYLSEENIKWKTSRISDEYLPKDFPRPKTRDEISNIPEYLQIKPTEYNFRANTPLRTMANLISLVTFSILFVIVILNLFQDLSRRFGLKYPSRRC